MDLQAAGKLDKPVFGVHYDTPENKFDFESVNPDNPFNEEDDDDDDEDDDDAEDDAVEEKIDGSTADDKAVINKSGEAGRGWTKKLAFWRR